MAYNPIWYQANRERVLAYQRDWSKKNPAARKAAEIKYRYGLTREDYESLLAYQDSKCAICREVLKTPYVDHHHGTGRVRGLLCKLCNFMIGLAQDNPNILQQAAEYLKEQDG